MEPDPRELSRALGDLKKMSVDSTFARWGGTPCTCHLSPAIYHLPPVTYHLSPATCHLPPATTRAFFHKSGLQLLMSDTAAGKFRTAEQLEVRLTCHPPPSTLHLSLSTCLQVVLESILQLVEHLVDEDSLRTTDFTQVGWVWCGLLWSPLGCGPFLGIP